MASRNIDPMRAAQGKRLAELRKKHGYTQPTLGAQLGISKSAVSEWERGKGAPSIDHLGTLNRLFRLDNEVLEIYGISVGQQGIGNSTAAGSIRSEMEDAIREAVDALQRVLDRPGRARP